MKNEQQKLALESENMLLTMMLNYPNSVAEIVGSLTTETFQNNQHKVIFGAISRIFKKQKKVDYFTILDDLIENNLLENAGGEFKLKQILNGYIGDERANDLIEIVYRSWQKREYNKIVTEALEKINSDGNSNDYLIETINQLQRINFDTKEKSVQSVDEIANDVTAELTKYRENPSSVQYVRTTFSRLDYFLGGFETGSLNIIGARAGVGKTSLAINIAMRLAQYFQRYQPSASVLYLTFEMPKNQIWKKMVSYEANLPLTKLRRGEGMTNEEWTTYHQAETRIRKLKIDIGDDAMMTAVKLRALIERKKRNNDLKVVFIDYIQLMNSENNKIENQPQLLMSLTRELKKIAMEMEIVIIGLSQINRSVDNRQDRKIYLSDLSGSSGLENNADTVLLLNRPKYYDEDEGDICEAEIQIAKNRHAGLGNVKFEFDKVNNRFWERTYKQN